MSITVALRAGATHPAQNSYRSRGHVIVLPGRGENEELYRRLGSRLSYDGYTVTVLDLPQLDEIDVDWLDRAGLDEGTDGLGPITLIGADSGAYLAAYLAARVGAQAVVLAGIGGLDFAPVATTDEDLLASRSTCPVYRGALASSRADLLAPVAQRFPRHVAARLQINALNVPVLVIHGENDPVTPLPDALGSYGALAPYAEVVTVAGGAHDILNETSHRSTSAEIVQFLERRDRPVLRRLQAVALGGEA